MKVDNPAKAEALFKESGDLHQRLLDKIRATPWTDSPYRYRLLELLDRAFIRTLRRARLMRDLGWGQR